MLTPLIACLLYAATATSPSPNTVSVLDLGAIPGEGVNNAPALREAAEHCRLNPGTTLIIPAGRYEFRDEDAVAIMDKALSGGFGNNPEPILYDRAFPHVRALDFTGCENVTIEAQGAILVLDGWYQPITLDRCANVAIKGLTLDYKRTPYSVGEIVSIAQGHYDARFDARYPLTKGLPAFCIDLYGAKERRRLGISQYNRPTELIAPDTLRIQADCPQDHLGDLCIMRHSAHGAPAVMIRNSRDIRLENVTIHTHPGMGVVGHKTTNLTFKGLAIVPRPGEIASTNTDATHFTSCSGRIVFDGCQFEGQGDDSTNIHNYYYTIRKGPREDSYLTCTKTDQELHALAPDYPEPGDTLELVDRKTLLPVRLCTVASVERKADAQESLLTLHAPIPGNLDDFMLINVSRLPEVAITNCHVRTHLARGMLIKTRKVLVEDCTIENTTGTAIHVGAEGDWLEGPASADVTIRRNRLIHCGVGHGTQNDACGVAVNVKTENPRVAGLHRRIVIDDNEIAGLNARRGIFVSGARDVVIRHNRITGCADPIRIEYSTSVQVHDNGDAAPSFGPGTEPRL